MNAIRRSPWTSVLAGAGIGSLVFLAALVVFLALAAVADLIGWRGLRLRAGTHVTSVAFAPVIVLWRIVPPFGNFLLPAVLAPIGWGVIGALLGAALWPAVGMHR